MGIIGFIMMMVGFVVLFNRVTRSERQLANLLDRLARLEQDKMGAPPPPATVKVAALAASAAKTVSAPVAEVPPPPPPPPTPAIARVSGAAPARIIGAPPSAEQAPPRVAPARPEATQSRVSLPKFSIPKVSLSFETLIGAKLPIWIGGIALILAGFFLVRYSVEQGLLGPAVRSVMAAVLGLVLLVGSEAARRIPRFAEDPRVGQALAGAGIASLYGTLYMAGQLYGLISPTAAFLLMAAVTAVALFLSLRHGAPTAIMGLVGGFTAPFMAAPSNSLVPLLLYLGLLIAGLFAVSIHRGWRWLAYAATGGGTLWTLGIMAANLTGIGHSLGVFIVVLAMAATLLFPRSGVTDSRLRLLPMVFGLVQLALFAPLIQFDATGWALYGLLSAASLYLGWRDEKLMPASVAALGLVLILLFGAFEQMRPLALWAAAGATLLFALPGHLLAQKGGVTQKYWTALALGGTAGPLLVAWISQRLALFTDTVWGLLFAALACVAASLSWRARSEGQEPLKPDWALFGGGVVAGLLSFIAVTHLVPDLWMAAGGFAVMLGVAAWAARVKDGSLMVASTPFGLVAGIFWVTSYLLRPALHDAIFVDGGIPPVLDLAALLLVPSVLFAATGWCHRGRISGAPLRWVGLAFASALALALFPALWHPAALLACAAALGLWAKQSSDGFRFRASLALVLPAGLFWGNQLILNPSVLTSIFADGAAPSALLIATLLIVPAALLALTSWCHKGQVSRETLRWLCLGLVIALILALVPYDWHGPAMAVMAATAAVGGARVPLPRFGLEAVFGVAAAWLVLRLSPFMAILVQSIVGVPTHFDLIDPVMTVLISCGLPALLFGLTAWKLPSQLGQRLFKAIIALAGVSGVATLYALIKQPLAIVSDGQFVAWGFTERAIITQGLAALGLVMMVRGGERLRLASFALLGLAAARLIWFDLLLFNPLQVDQIVGGLPIANAATVHFGLAALVCWWAGARLAGPPLVAVALRFSALGLVILSLGLTVRQMFQGPILTAPTLPNAENYGYSAAFLLLSLVWLWRGIAGSARWLRMTGLGLLTLVTLKVFLIDAAALEGLLRVLSFLGLGGALIGIGWVYTRVLTREAATEAKSEA